MVPKVNFVLGSTFCVIILLISSVLQLIMVRVGNRRHIPKPVKETIKASEDSEESA